MRHPINEQAITVSVGQFIKTIRDAEENNKRIKPSMYSILLKNGVKSAKRARSLVQNMLDNNVIIKHRDGSYSLTRKNWDFKDLMPLLIKRTYTKKQSVSTNTPVVVIQEDVNPLEKFDPQELVNFLRSKGWTVKATRPITIIEELW